MHKWLFYASIKKPKAKKVNWRGITLKKLVLKFGSAIASFALMVTALNVNTTCYFLIHQPKLPKGSEKLRKI
jgi:cyclic lactone autoinducer peptide